MQCIFCDIASGAEPGYIVYEDEKTKAFLDRAPAAEGHTLVIPKKHSKDLFDVSSEDAQAVMVAVKKVATAQMKGLGASAVNIVHASGKDAGQDVFHFHVHVIPRRPDDEIKQYRWWKPRYDLRDHAGATAEKIKAAIPRSTKEKL